MKVTDLAVWTPNEPDGSPMTDETGAVPQLHDDVCVSACTSVCVFNIMYNGHIFR